MPTKGKGAVGKGSGKPSTEQKNANRNNRPTGLKAIQLKNRAMSAARSAGAQYKFKQAVESASTKKVLVKKSIKTPDYGGAGAGESMYSDRARRFFGALGEMNKRKK